MVEYAPVPIHDRADEQLVEEGRAVSPVVQDVDGNVALRRKRIADGLDGGRVRIRSLQEAAVVTNQFVCAVARQFLEGPVGENDGIVRRFGSVRIIGVRVFSTAASNSSRPAAVERTFWPNASPPAALCRDRRRRTSASSSSRDIALTSKPINFDISRLAEACPRRRPSGGQAAGPRRFRFRAVTVARRSGPGDAARPAGGGQGVSHDTSVAPEPPTMPRRGSHRRGIAQRAVTLHPTVIHATGTAFLPVLPDATYMASTSEGGTHACVG